jgi:hypothetical protein
MNASSKQRGFIAGPILVAIALVVAVAALIVFANRGTSTNISPQRGKMYASVFIKQAADMGTGYSLAIADSVTATSITFDTSINTGLFQPSKGYVAGQSLPKGACPSQLVGECAWNMTKGVVLNGVGTALGDVIVSATGLDVSTCEAVNGTLYNEVATGSGTNIPATTVVYSAIIAATLESPVDALVPASGFGRGEGCISTGGKYAYYKAIGVR